MEPVNHCSHCGAAVDVNASVCPECGQELVKRKYCPHCGERIDADCIICPKCGKQAGSCRRISRSILSITIIPAHRQPPVHRWALELRCAENTAISGRHFSCACSWGISVRINSMKGASAWESCICSPLACLALAGLLISS